MRGTAVNPSAAPATPRLSEYPAHYRTRKENETIPPDLQIRLGGVLVATLLALVTPVGGAVPSAAPLKADELLLIYNADDSDSRELASHYARLRQVPADRLLGVKVDPRSEQMSAPDFDQKIQGPVRTFLTESKLQDKVRCLVTFRGIPTTIAGRQPTPEQAELLPAVRRQFAQALEQFERAVLSMESIQKGTTTAPVNPRPPADQDYAPLVQRYVAARAESWKRIILAPPAGTTDAGERNRLVQLVQVAEGSAILFEQMQVAPGSDAQARIAAMKEKGRQETERAVEILSRGVRSPDRAEALRLIRENHGLLGLLRVLERDLTLLRTDETAAAVDSELALTWWDDYPKHRWVVNALNWHAMLDASVRQQLTGVVMKPTLMVSRLDGPSARTVRRMIDDALRAEATGLAGTVYLDARGLKKDASMGAYDQNLRDLGALLWRHATFPTRLDNQGNVFGVGKCPDAMLYCGWYSLRSYVPSFKFVPGAVGYHIASFEAISIRDPQEKGWCKGLLDDGIAATLGPVAEPYLHAFPPPREFFGLLLTGRFTLAECYAYSSTLNSWMMMLLGDPLYTPFRKIPVIALETVFPPEQIPPQFRTLGASQPAASSPAQ